MDRFKEAPSRPPKPVVVKQNDTFSIPEYVKEAHQAISPKEVQEFASSETQKWKEAISWSKTTLGLSSNCTEDEIKKAYRKLMLQYHPDTGKDRTAGKAPLEYDKINMAKALLDREDERQKVSRPSTSPKR